MEPALPTLAGDFGVDEQQRAELSGLPAGVERFDGFGTEDRPLAGPIARQPRIISLLGRQVGGGEAMYRQRFVTRFGCVSGRGRQCSMLRSAGEGSTYRPRGFDIGRLPRLEDARPIRELESKATFWRNQRVALERAFPVIERASR
ncbi:MAG: hypothetical protein ACTHMG_03925, partial [Sphingomonas sp.]